MLRKSTFMFINVRVEFFRKDLASLFMMTKSDAFACFRGLPFGFSTMSEKQSQKKADEFLIKELFFFGIRSSYYELFQQKIFFWQKLITSCSTTERMQPGTGEKSKTVANGQKIRAFSRSFQILIQENRNVTLVLLCSST